MDLPAALATHLRELADVLGTPGDGLVPVLTTLDGDLRAAVSSYAGLRLTLAFDTWPVTLTSFPGIDGVRPKTSLRMALTTLDDGFDRESTIVLYAYTPGAFVDLAADVAYLDRPGDFALDADLPPVSVASGFSGLDEYSAVNRAVGVLMGGGETPTEALATLRREAATAGLSLPDHADRVLGG